MLKHDMEKVLTVDQLSHADPWNRIDFREYYRHTREGDSFVAEVSDDILGFVMAVHDGTSSEIIRLAVHPKHRRRGLGRLLVNTIGQTVGQDVSLEYFCEEANTTAQLFLARCGFLCANRLSFGEHTSYLFRRGWRFNLAPDLNYRMTC